MRVHVNPLKAGFPSVQFYRFPECNPYWFLKFSILGTCLFCAGCNSWSACCGAQISCSSGKSFIPLMSFLKVIHSGWSVDFNLWQVSLCLSILSQYCSLFLCWGDPVHSIFRSMSEEVIPHVIVDVLCTLGRWESEFGILLCHCHESNLHWILTLSVKLYMHSIWA